MHLIWRHFITSTEGPSFVCKKTCARHPIHPWFWSVCLRDTRLHFFAATQTARVAFTVVAEQRFTARHDKCAKKRMKMQSAHSMETQKDLRTGFPLESNTMESVATLGRRKWRNVAAGARLGTLPPMEAIGDVLGQIYGYSNPSDTVFLLFGWEFPQRFVLRISNEDWQSRGYLQKLLEVLDG